MQKMYNIATIEIIRDAKIFDFTYSPEKIKEDEYSIVADLHRISEEFSKPNFGDQIEYAPTQFLCILKDLVLMELSLKVQYQQLVQMCCFLMLMRKQEFMILQVQKCILLIH